jgi:predicted dehydrogenase
LSRTEFFDERDSFVARCWEDVENWCTAIITFEDGTRGLVSASYNCIGGMRDSLDIFMSNARFHCDLGGTSSFRAFAPFPTTFGTEPLSEKLETNAGWSFPLVAEEFTLGYQAEMSDFLNVVRTASAPKSDASLARDVLAVVYGAYASAEEGREVTLTPVLAAAPHA